MKILVSLCKKYNQDNSNLNANKLYFYISITTRGLVVLPEREEQKEIKGIGVQWDQQVLLDERLENEAPRDPPDLQESLESQVYLVYLDELENWERPEDQVTRYKERPGVRFFFYLWDTAWLHVFVFVSGRAGWERWKRRGCKCFRLMSFILFKKHIFIQLRIAVCS